MADRVKDVMWYEGGINDLYKAKLYYLKICNYSQEEYDRRLEITRELINDLREKCGYRPLPIEAFDD